MEFSSSKAKTAGRYLKFEFRGDPPYLYRIEFRFNSDWKPHYFQRGDELFPLDWKDLESAIISCFLGYLHWSLSGEVGRFLFGEHREHEGLLNTLSNSIHQTKSDIRYLFFGDNPRDKERNPDVTHLVFPSIPGFSKSGKSKKRPFRIGISEIFLPADCIQVFWQRPNSAANYQLTREHEVKKFSGFFNAIPACTKDSNSETRFLDSPEAGVFNTEKYTAALIDRYGLVPLETLDPTGTFYQPLPLTSIFVPQKARDAQQFLAPVIEYSKNNVKSVGFSDLKILNAPIGALDKTRRHYDEQGECSVIDVVSDSNNKRVVILGALGAGKSSVVHYQAMRWAEASKKEKMVRRIPIIIELKSYAEARRNDTNIRDFVDYLSRGPGSNWKFNEGFIKTQLETGNIDMFFDGLDEVFNSSLCEEVGISIIRFANEFPDVHIVVTSRLLGHRETGLRRAGFSHFVLQDFDDSQIEHFVSNWFQVNLGQNASSEMVRNSAEKFRKFLFSSNTLHELARSPFFLAIILLLGRVGGSPKCRSELIEQCSNMILERWKVDDALRADPDLSLDATALGLKEKKEILRQIAQHMTMCAEFPSNIISVDDLEAVIAKSIANFVNSDPMKIARAMIRQFRERNGILRLDSVAKFAFTYPAFLEFYCADDLRHRCFVQKSINETDLKRFFTRRILQKQHWEDIFCLFCEMIDQAAAGVLLGHIFALGQKRDEGLGNLFLVAECLKEMKDSSRVQSNFLSKLKAKLILLSIDKKEIGEPSVDGFRSIRKRTVGYAKKGENAFRAIEYLGVIYAGNESVAAHLKNIILLQKDYGIRTYALQALSHGWGCRADFYEMMLELINDKRAGIMREYLLIELAKRCQNSDTLDYLKKLSNTAGETMASRSTAIDLVAMYWKENEETLTWLRYMFDACKSGDIKRSAVSGIGRFSDHDNAIMPWLIEIARKHPYVQVREGAVETIAEHLSDSKKLLKILKEIAVSDKHPQVRVSACGALADKFPENEEVLDFFAANEANQWKDLAALGC